MKPKFAMLGTELVVVTYVTDDGMACVTRTDDSTLKVDPTALSYDMRAVVEAMRGPAGA